MISAKFVKTESTTEHIISFYFEPTRSVNYIPGQFIEMKLPHEEVDDRGESRWFTLSSSPTEDLLAITTKIDPKKPSTYMNTLRNLDVGSLVTMQLPMGDFVLPKDESIPLVWVAGGIGCTPFRSMLKYLCDRNKSRKITMIYATSDTSEIAFRKLFEKLGDCFHIIDTKRNGKLFPEQITTLVNYIEPYYYLAGPEQMIESLQDSLIRTGIDKNHIHSDFFPGYHRI